MPVMPVSPSVSPFSQQPLRPCPFCGNSDLWVNGDLEPKFVVCRKCSAFGPTAPTITEATNRWNNRPDSHAPQT
jgi:Lar family restriction alleviation protein